MAVDEFGGVVADDTGPQVDEFGGVVSTEPTPTQMESSGVDEFGGIISGNTEVAETDEFGGNILKTVKNVMFPAMSLDLLSPDKIGKVGKSLLSAKDRTIGAVAQLPRMFQEQQRVISEDVPTMQMEMLEGLGVDVPDFVKQAHQKLIETSVQRMNPLSGLVEAVNTAESIPALKKLNDAVEKFAVEKIKNSETIREGMMEHKESVGQLLKEGRVIDLSEKIGDLAIAEAPQLAIQAALAYLSKGASLGYMGLSAASSKYASLTDEEISPIQRVGNAFGTGLTEYYSEKLGTGRVLDKAINGKLMSTGAKKVREILIDAMGGSVSEGVAAIGENTLDMLVGMDASLGDGVAESLILGAMFDGGTSVAGQINTAHKIDRFRDGLIASGATEQEADSVIERSQKIENVQQQRELDTEIGEILKRNKTANNNEIKQEALNARGEELLRKETLSDNERVELTEILQNVNAVQASEIEAKMLRKDIHNLAKTNPFALHPRDISRTTSEADLKDTLDALEDLYGYRPTKKQVLDAFHDPMQKQKIETEGQQAAEKERQLSELEKKAEQQRKGEISGAELLEFMGNIDAEIASEFTERTTGENQERPKDVIKDIIKNQKQQEAQDDTERKPTTGTEQEGVTGQEPIAPTEAEQGATVQEPGAAEESKVETPKKVAVETIKPISEVKDTPIAKTEKLLQPPNPQLPVAKWWKEMTAFALQEVQAGKTRAEFISDMDENLHYDVVEGELDGIWKDANIEAKRVASEIAKAEKVSAKAKITQKQFKDTKTETVKSSELIKQLFKVQQRASQQGRRAGINEIKQAIRDFKGSANELVGEFRNQMEDLRGATKLERSNLKNAVANIKLAQTPEAQAKAFEQAIDMLHSTFESINERTPRYEYVPFAEATTESGVDKNSKYQDVRAKFLEYGGQPEVRSNKDMLNFLNGTETQAAGRFVEKERVGMTERDSRMKDSKMLRAIHKMHVGGGKMAFLGPGRYNMFDFLGHISRGNPDSNLSLMRRRLAEGEVDAGSNRKILEEKASEINTKGKASSKVMNTKVTITTPVGKKKVGLGEIIMIDMALENKDNVDAMENNDFRLDQGGKTFRATKAEFEAMVKEALEQVSPEVKSAYETSKELYEAIVNLSGDMVSPVANQVMKDLGLEQSFKKIDGKYVPIVLGDISVGEAIEIEIPDGNGGTEVQKIADNYVNREIHKGKYKERVGGSKGGTIRVGTLDSVLSHIMDTSADFAAKGVMMNDLLKLLNNKGLKTQINRTFGSNFAKLLMEKAYQTTGNAKSLNRTPLDRGLSKAFGLVDPYRLSRPSTGLIMASSAQMVRPFLKNSESFQLGLKHGGSKFIQDIIKNDGFTYSRYSGRAFSPELAEQGAKLKTRSGGTTGETRASSMISLGDKGAISVVYASTAFDEMISKGLGTTMEDLQKQDSDFWRDVSVRVAYETMRTQPSGTSAAVSVWKGRARDNIIWRLATRYGSQGSRIYNNLVDAVDEYAYNPSEENRQQLHSVVESQVITNTAILSGIKATRRSTKIAIVAMIMGMMGKDDEEVEEMKKKRDEEIDKIIPSFFANFARTQLRTVEGVDDIIGLIDFFRKPYVDDPFSGVMTSELRDMKDVGMDFKTALKWDKILRTGQKEKTVNNKKVMMPITGVERRRYEEYYSDSIERVLNKSRGLALIMSRLPLAGLEDVSFGEDMIGEKIVKARTD